jgi:hypothetical protein
VLCEVSPDLPLSLCTLSSFFQLIIGLSPPLETDTEIETIINNHQHSYLLQQLTLANTKHICKNNNGFAETDIV